MSEDIKRRSSLEECEYVWENNIKAEPHGIKCDVVDWIQQA